MQIHRYLVNGHHYVKGYLVATSGRSAFSYDRSYDGGVWYRACGAGEWVGNPYGNPQWGYNIACTGWY